MRRFPFLVALSLFVFFVNSSIIGQTQDSLPEVKVTGRYFESPQSIVIRWVPSTPGLWLMANYYGYKVEKAVYPKNEPGDIKWELVYDTLKPRTLTDWRQKALAMPTDTFFMMAGQAVHQPKQNQAFAMEKMLQQSNDLSNLYSACVISSEFSKDAAIYSALRFDDTKVEKGKSYLYRITSHAPYPDTSSRPTGIVLVDAEPDDPLPKIVSKEVREGEQYVEIFWDKTMYAHYYSAFNVYKSQDGKSFSKINKVPTAPLAYKDPNSYVLRDSVDVNYKKYFYKIEGLTSYGTKGPLSDPIEAKGKDRTPPDAPFNVRFQYLGNRMMKISWEVNPDDKDIAGFRISKSNEEQKDIIELTKSPLGPNIRTYIDSLCNENINNYYWIGIFDKEGNVNVTVPNHGTIIDSIPPAIPSGFTGTIDTSGVVTLTWKKGLESDLKGYIIHFSNNENLTFYSLTDYAVKDTFWRDTIPLNVLTEEIYYKILALDHRSNASPFSSVLTLKKPDLVPPSAPVFIESLNTEYGLEIKWANSQSHDVTKNVLKRRKAKDAAYEVLYISQGGVKYGSFTDKKMEANVNYEYVLEAHDDAGNISPHVGVLKVTGYEVKKVDPVTDVRIITDKEKKPTLTWNHSSVSDHIFIVYRSVNNSSFISYKTVKNDKRFSDKLYKATDIVKYKIQAINDRGWRSDFSKEVVAALK